MNVEIATVATQFLFWEYLFQIFCIGSLQCGRATPEGRLFEQLAIRINGENLN